MLFRHNGNLVTEDARKCAAGQSKTLRRSKWQKFPRALRESVIPGAQLYEQPPMKS